ncbi:MAG: DNA-3-methyladenine glycosylase 2 family protein [Proteobacteria bacterium]|nr:DNA-3-methyladenine glycosylase 2 family protein [Pseudomonadota bacterium]
MVIIRSEADIEAGLEALAVLDPALAPIIAVAGAVPLRLSPPGFASLAHIIVSQMVSRASAMAIWNRMLVAGPVTPEAYCDLNEEVIRALGLSRAKGRTLAAAANAILDGRLELEALETMPIEAALGKLTALSGIGPWTAEIYMMFAAGHADLFPAGDIALRKAVAHALLDGNVPSVTALADHAQRWSPWRAVAARLFWAYYARAMGRDGLPVS